MSSQESLLLNSTSIAPAFAPKNMMMKDGKFFEEVVRLVQEVLKNDAATAVFKNHKVEDRDGKKREFDVFVTSEMNGEPIQIAIECKDHSRKISRSLVEAYATKCGSIPNINKRVFVSRRGFTDGAKLTARNNDISLYTLADLDVGKINEWLGTTMILPALVMPVITAKSVATSTEMREEPELTDIVQGVGFEEGVLLWKVARLIGELALLKTGGFTGKFFFWADHTYICTMPFKEGVELVSGGVVYQLQSMTVEVGACVEKPDVKVRYDQYRSLTSGLTVDTASSISDTGTITVVKKEGSDESTVHASFDLKAAQEVFRMKVERFNAGDESAFDND